MNLIQASKSIDVVAPLGSLVPRPCLFLTNDDGVEAPGLQELIRALHSRGFPIIVFAPAREQSASGMRISLRHDLKFTERADIVDNLQSNPEIPLHIFSLDGTPCDCVIVGLDGGIAHWVPDLVPALCVSGANNGPNLSVDVMHSGTVSAAREACLYGLPAIATSLATYEHTNYAETIDATVDLVERCVSFLPERATNLLRPNGSRTKPIGENSAEILRSAFTQGNILLNLNAPPSWTNGFQTVSLGVRWYHNAIDMSDTEHMGVAYEVGAAQIEDEPIEGTDCQAINEGSVAITPLSAWPANHPLGIDTDLLNEATKGDSQGFPYWLDESNS